MRNPHLWMTLLPAVLLATTAPGQISLQPKHGHEMVEGVRLEHLEFRDGGTRIHYTPPEQWKVFPADPHRISFADITVPAGEVTITCHDNGAVATDELQKAAVLDALPSEAEHPAPPGDPVSAITIARSVVWEYTIDYQLHNRSYRRSVMFLTFEHCQFRFTITAPQPDFARLRGKLVGSLCTWAWEDEKHLTPVTLKLNKKEEKEPLK